VPGLDTEALAQEIRLHVGEELDYLQEATNQRHFAAAFAGHPFITVPDVIPELCGPRVLVSDYVDGIGFEELKDAGADVRNRVGEAVYRFFCGTLYRRGEFSGDPHPGNFKLQADGRIAFFDFGLVKRMDAASVKLELDCQRAAAEGDAPRLHRTMAAAGIFPQPDRIEPDELLDYVRSAIGWYLVDEELELTPEMATRAIVESAAPQSSHFRKFRHQHLPPEHALARRMDVFTLALLGQLHARANWYRIASEWMYGAEPRTELGALEATWTAP
jgi:ABC1 atypical kinase-like domain